MRKIWKFELDPSKEVQLIELPHGSSVLTVGKQGNKIVLWARFETATVDSHTIQRAFRVAMTGHPYEDDDLRTYIGTVQFETKGVSNPPQRADGRPTLGDLIGPYTTIDYFVCHVFEETP
jgi:hypothetical protein